MESQVTIDLYPEFGWMMNGEAVYAPGSIFEGMPFDKMSNLLV
jgi:hypothetical protein